MIDASEPFARPVRPRWIPPEMLHPPKLEACVDAGPVQPRYASAFGSL